MKKSFLIILAVLIINLFSFGIAEARIINVKGHIKPSTGKYVMPYLKTSPNNTKIDNWSTKGNTNPITGKKGSVPLIKTPTIKNPTYKAPTKILKTPTLKIQKFKK